MKWSIMLFIHTWWQLWQHKWYALVLKWIQHSTSKNEIPEAKWQNRIEVLNYVINTNCLLYCIQLLFCFWFIFIYDKKKMHVIQIQDICRSKYVCTLLHLRSFRYSSLSFCKTDKHQMQLNIICYIGVLIEIFIQESTKH